MHSFPIASDDSPAPGGNPARGSALGAHRRDRAVDPFARLLAARDEEFFPRWPADEARLLEDAARHRPERHRRTRVVETLDAWWGSLDLDDAAQEARALLRSPEARIVITGQQPAMDGGPLHLYSKALSCARLARRLRERDLPAVALFWIADEDHDVGELFAGRPGPGVEAPGIPWPPGRIPIAALPPREATPAPRAACAGRAPADDFRDRLLEILPGEGILPVHPSWLRELGGPLIAAEIRAPGRLAREVEPAVARLRARSLPVPIPTCAALPLFLIGDDGGRHRLEVEGDRVRARVEGAEPMALTELAALAEEEPARFSPDALLRPLLQDAILEPFATILGPTELGYHLQLIDAYRRRELLRPTPFLRLRARVIDRADAEFLEEHGIDAALLAHGIDPRELVPSQEAQRWVDELRGSAAPLLQQLEEFRRRPEGRSLARRLERLSRRLENDLEKLEAAVRREVVGDTRTLRGAVAEVAARLRQDGVSSERRLSVHYYTARYGASFLRELGAQFDPFDPRERLVVADPVNGA